MPDLALADPLTPMLRLFKALADESRLRIVGILAQGPRSVDELAALLQLRSPTISHHLARLRQADLLSMRSDGNVHLYQLDMQALRALSRELLSVERVRSLSGTLEPQGWEHKVLRDFLDGERLKEIPASRKKRGVVLEWLASKFQPDQRYGEIEVNRILERHHPDPATLRRELVGAALLQREHSVYWRPAEAAR
ncbi:MAG: metalloregulator ArsR/SmtB family transcription factor [Chloroflexota bacterium]|nr:metalloregulator ArsR/SmtB family transcription factor [Chloroflexota bacterium]